MGSGALYGEGGGDLKVKRETLHTCTKMRYLAKLLAEVGCLIVLLL